LQNLSLFHGLGCPVLLGASRKRFIGDVTGTPVAADRVPGSLAVAVLAIGQGVQILRVHDVAETRAARDMWQAVTCAPQA
jgi:dihydropteroate synthase